MSSESQQQPDNAGLTGTVVTVCLGIASAVAPEPAKPICFTAAIAVAAFFGWHFACDQWPRCRAIHSRFKVYVAILFVALICTCLIVGYSGNKNETQKFDSADYPLRSAHDQQSNSFVLLSNNFSIATNDLFKARSNMDWLTRYLNAASNQIAELRQNTIHLSPEAILRIQAELTKVKADVEFQVYRTEQADGQLAAQIATAFTSPKRKDVEVFPIEQYADETLFKVQGIQIHVFETPEEQLLATFDTLKNTLRFPVKIMHNLKGNDVRIIVGKCVRLPEPVL